eukprot:2108799-Prymnesium_polylepis.1
MASAVPGALRVARAETVVASARPSTRYCAHYMTSWHCGSYVRLRSPFRFRYRMMLDGVARSPRTLQD